MVMKSKPIVGMLHQFHWSHEAFWASELQSIFESLTDPNRLWQLPESNSTYGNCGKVSRLRNSGSSSRRVDQSAIPAQTRGTHVVWKSAVVAPSMLLQCAHLSYENQDCQLILNPQTSQVMVSCRTLLPISNFWLPIFLIIHRCRHSMCDLFPYIYAKFLRNFAAHHSSNIPPPCEFNPHASRLCFHFLILYLWFQTSTHQATFYLGFNLHLCPIDFDCPWFPQSLVLTFLP